MIAEQLRPTSWKTWTLAITIHLPPPSREMASLEEAEWELIFLNFEPSHPIPSRARATPGGAAIAIYPLPTVWCFYTSNHLSESVHLNYTGHGHLVARQDPRHMPGCCRDPRTYSLLVIWRSALGFVACGNPAMGVRGNGSVCQRRRR